MNNNGRNKILDLMSRELLSVNFYILPKAGPSFFSTHSIYMSLVPGVGRWSVSAAQEQEALLFTQTKDMSPGSPCCFFQELSSPD
jgi:hypothetical protein